jgi:hypothetical protein
MLSNDMHYTAASKSPSHSCYNSRLRLLSAILPSLVMYAIEQFDILAAAVSISTANSKRGAAMSRSIESQSAYSLYPDARSIHSQ